MEFEIREKKKHFNNIKDWLSKLNITNTKTINETITDEYDIIKRNIPEEDLYVKNWLNKLIITDTK